MLKRATKYGLESIIAEVTTITPPEKQTVIKTTEGSFTARAVITAAIYVEKFLT
ncbi:MAG: hypothetical protein J7K77_05015 [Dehalococcoidales bacterium]|nr:hypothetical protein [Dehalococcoidales bacterium]